MTSKSPAPIKVAIIGTGRRLGTEGATGFGMAHRHIAGYDASGRCRLVAVADIRRELGEAFVAEHAPEAKVFTDFRKMMRSAKPDVVSVCLWPHLHAEVVCAAAEFKPRAILCEKPMDIHWDAALRMHEACKRQGVLLAVNHQRRFNLPLVKAKELLDAGEIGGLVRIDGAWNDIADSGSHVLDMMFFYNNDTPAEWVLGQIDMRQTRVVFGMIHAGHGLSEFRFQNGVRAVFHFGRQHAELGCLLRLTGERGTIEILFNSPWLRIRRHSQPDWEILDTGENIHDDKAIYRGIADILSSLDTGALPQLASERALRATEIIFATHESSRRRARVDLPLPAGPDAMLSMIASGELKTDLPA